MSGENTYDETFFDMASHLVVEETDRLLDVHLAQAVRFLQMRREEGKRADVYALIEHFKADPRKRARGPMLAVYAAAVYRLLEAGRI